MYVQTEVQNRDPLSLMILPNSNHPHPKYSPSPGPSHRNHNNLYLDRPRLLTNTPCLTKEEAKKQLECSSCEDAVMTDEELDCGCNKWECRPKEEEKDCSGKCDECSECKQVMELG